MTKILAFGASNSRNSINQRLAAYTASQVDGVEVNLIDLNDFEMPIFSIDREKKTGIPDEAIEFQSLIKESDGIIVSFAEHNGSFTAAYKNIFDWISRIDRNIWLGKPMFLMATSPGTRGGKTVFDYQVTSLPRQNAKLVASFSLPSFNDNFSESDGIRDEKLKEQFQIELKNFQEALNTEQNNKNLSSVN